MFRVFISGPIAADTLERECHNVEIAMEVAHILIKEGLAVYLPHVFWYVDRHIVRRGLEPLKSAYLPQDIEWLKQSNVVLRLNGESPGGDTETQAARDYDIPVYTNIDEVITLSKLNQGE